ncbi:MULTISPECIES: YbfB/YjiJ family MFS transporter [Acidovorax]|uniref:YbfB/YjiJ family MFS transporter n=1 Tax=Acidovorax facilis TaxID=12917 RepID=A0ABV8DHW3_9BURK|nr:MULTISPECIES: YbfB/YjiJ family MFS transporter [Acidovorax]KQB56249.1 MFS transporter [Acidovorax sp. SD340]MBO1010851.1 YbfB/YjiJ family MFS transporter [Acidovorax sp. SD340]MCO4244868.1 YbfB/YjiJ family MFS transporter [Acidovorax facilis]
MPSPPPFAPLSISPLRSLWLAVALSMGAAISLGITRFAYALLLPPMREDLGWSYALAGGMNTGNALGYLLGALATPSLLRRAAPGAVLLVGAAMATVFMGLSGFFTQAAPLLVQRLLAGGASALVFIAGGLLAARLGAEVPGRSGLLLGLYYGGTGWGISLSALLVPAVLVAAPAPHNWTWAWWALALACVAATTALLWPARVLNGLAAPVATASGTPPEAAVPDRVRWRALAPALLGYGLFGVGYIGYMTFVVALLREQGRGAGEVTLFYALLGLAVVLSSRIWAGLLDRSRGGEALARLNALLGVATILPVVTGAWPVVLASGLLFGGVFLSVVASTTALVRHNLPQALWASGISAFTIVFAAGQIVGPTVVGWIADGPGGLARGLVFSACALWVGALVAWRQRPL